MVTYPFTKSYHIFNCFLFLVVIVVFDLSKPETLTNTRRWFLDAMQTCGDMLPYVFLVGTKKDLLVSNLELQLTINNAKIFLGWIRL